MDSILNSRIKSIVKQMANASKSDKDDIFESWEEKIWELLDSLKPLTEVLKDARDYAEQLAEYAAEDSSSPSLDDVVPQLQQLIDDIEGHRDDMLYYTEWQDGEVEE